MSAPGSSSCDPAMLDAFSKVGVEVADGMGQRIAQVQAATGPYMAGCDPTYTVDVSGVPAGLGGWGIEVHQLSDWTDAIARAFAIADAPADLRDKGGAWLVKYWEGLKKIGAVDGEVSDQSIVDNLSARFKSNPYMGQSHGQGNLEWNATTLNQLDEESAKLAESGLAQTLEHSSQVHELAQNGAEVYLSLLKLGGNDTSASVADAIESSPAFHALGAWLGGALTLGTALASNADVATALAKAGGAVAIGVGSNFVGEFLAGTVLDAEDGPLAPVAGFALATLGTFGFNKLFEAKPDEGNPNVVASQPVQSTIASSPVGPALNLASQQSVERMVSLQTAGNQPLHGIIRQEIPNYLGPQASRSYVGFPEPGWSGDPSQGFGYYS